MAALCEDTGVLQRANAFLRAKVAALEAALAEANQSLAAAGLDAAVAAVAELPLPRPAHRQRGAAGAGPLLRGASQPSGVAAMSGGGGIKILEEDFDANYTPTADEVNAFATWLGMDLATDADLLWIAQEGLMQPLPTPWKPCSTDADGGEIFYFNRETGESIWEHPNDAISREKFKEAKRKREAGSSKTPTRHGGSSARPRSSGSVSGPAGCTVLDEVLDPKYEPTKDEINEFAMWLGMDLYDDKDLLYIARDGLKSALPDNWKPCKTNDSDEIFYFNFKTGATTWVHPTDDHFRGLFEAEKLKRDPNWHPTVERTRKGQRGRG